MRPDRSLHERLLRLLDGRLDPAERSALEAELRDRPEAREALRDLAEHSVMIADLERTTAARRSATLQPVPRAAVSRPWLRGLAAAAGLALVLGAAAWWFRQGEQEIGRVVKVTGAGSYFGTRGAATDAVRLGAGLRAGDALETRSCDSWIEVELRDGTHLTLAGQSALRLLAPSNGAIRMELSRGNLWSTSATNTVPAPLSIRMPTARLDTRGAQFDVQAAGDGAFVRVNGGLARVFRAIDGAATAVTAGQQSLLTLTPGEGAVAVPQSPPVTSWSSDQVGVPDVVLGRWLPPGDQARLRLAAEPLLWPIPDRPPVTLHAVSVSVLRGGGHPVLLQAGSRIRIRGQTTRAQTVRFGFSTQRMRGVFAGKFELDVPVTELGPVGQPWEITRRVTDFVPLQAQLAASPAGLELYDLYALTIHVDAGLEIHHMELSIEP